MTEAKLNRKPYRATGTKTPREWIEFVELRVSASGITKIWSVVDRSNGSPLGQISWFGRWRRYSFMPNASTVWEQDCLRCIAEFIEKKTREHKNTQGPEPAGEVAEG
jgi:hypothetical protein